MIISTIIGAAAGIISALVLAYRSGPLRRGDELNNMKGQIDMALKQMEQTNVRNDRLEQRIEKLEKKDRTKTQAINSAYRCIEVDDVEKKCPVILHLIKKGSDEK